jgi:hypothetical protein
MGLAARRLVRLEDLLFQHTVGNLLEQWGNWGCSGVGTGSLSTPSYENVYWINDDIGLWLDRAIAQLGLCDERKKLAGYKMGERKRAVWLFYRERYNISMTANALKVGETKAAVILKSAEGWIEGHLTIPFVMAK